MAKFGIKIGVDLGTRNTLVYVHGKGIVFDEPSVVAYSFGTQEVLAVGHDANAMIGKTHDMINITRPMSLGVISDLEACKGLLQYVLTKIDIYNMDLSKSTLLICCPSEITEIEKDALIELAHELGIKDVFIEEEIKAGAIGTGIDVFRAKGCFVVDIGGGTTDVGILAVGDIVVSQSIRVAGEYMDDQLKKYIQYRHKLLIGPTTAERIKRELGTVAPDVDPEKTIRIAGRDLMSGLPRKITISQEEVRDVLVPCFDQIADVVRRLLQQTPPELAADVMERGAIFNGGCAKIEGIKEFMEDRIGIEANISKNCLTAVVEGTKVLLMNRGNYRHNSTL